MFSQKFNPVLWSNNEFRIVVLSANILVPLNLTSIGGEMEIRL